LAVVRAINPHMDFDLWWHLRTGESIVQQHHVPTTDRFSRHGLETDQPWVAYSWLFEILTYGVYQMFSLPGIVILRLALALMVAITVHWFVARREPRFKVAALIVAAILLTLQPLMSERPWMFTMLFSVLLLDGLLEWRAGKSSRRYWLFPLMFALWANVHIQFVYGFVILGIACVAPLGDWVVGWWRSRRGDDDKNASREPTIACAFSKPWWHLLLITGMCVLATLLNPYGYRLYQVVVEYGTQWVPLAVVSELQPLPFRCLQDYVMPALALVALFFYGRRRQWSFFEVLLIVAATWFSFRMKRDIWFMALVALTLLVPTLPVVACEGEEPERWRFAPSLRQAVFLMVTLMVFAVITWHVRIPDEDAIEDQLVADYPVGAVFFLKATHMKGPLYNEFTWGGYLIWHLPELPVSIDGRTNIQGDARMLQSHVTWSGMPGWDRDPELFSSGLVLGEAKAPVTNLMRNDPRFALVYEDRRAVIFKVVKQDKSEAESVASRR
jgi:hypothetical protein